MGRRFVGLHGDAGAIGSLTPDPDNRTADSPAARSRTTAAPLLSVASLLKLGLLYQAAGLAISAVAEARALKSPWRQNTETWLAQPAVAVA